jgi:hypothetical protein
MVSDNYSKLKFFIELNSEGSNGYAAIMVVKSFNLLIS